VALEGIEDALGNLERRVLDRLGGEFDRLPGDADARGLDRTNRSLSDLGPMPSPGIRVT